MPLYFITGNDGKFREVSSLIPSIVQLSVELDEIQSLDPQVVIEHKLAQAATSHAGEFIVEDTSLIFNYIKPLPGTLIKWFVQSLGSAGMAEQVSHYPDHTAVARVTIGYRDIAGLIHFFSAETNGQIVAPRGDNGFGWDSIFLAEGQTLTNAELSRDEKNAISHRGKAVRLLSQYLIETSQT